MRSASITIPQPCHESWAAMTPASGGRHCAACQKTVVDFTHKTDAEVLAYLARAAGTSCGRFRADQLARPLHPAAPVSRWRSWLSAMLAVGGVLHASRAAAQVPRHAGGPALVAAGAAVRPALPAASTLTGGSLRIYGTVKDAENGLPLPGTTVLLAGTTTGTTTDVNGEFSLLVPDSDKALILVSALGYCPIRQVAREVNNKPLAILLRPDADTLWLGEAAVVGGYAAPRILPPAPWHPRRLYYWGRYWLTRPFR